VLSVSIYTVLMQCIPDVPILDNHVSSTAYAHAVSGIVSTGWWRLILQVKLCSFRYSEN